MKHDQCCGRRRLGLAALLPLLLLTTPHESAGQSQNPPATHRIGLRKQLLVDDFVIDEMQNLTRELGSVTKANGGKPIFTEGRFYGTVLHDAGRFKMWYRLQGGKGYGYAESKDGTRFQKVAKISGINFAGDYTLSVTIDPHETDSEHRYKSAYDAPGMAAGLAHSADGVRWTPYNSGKPVTHRAADTYNQIIWDEDAKVYRLFTRTDFGTAGGSGEWRGVRSMTNPDVKANPAQWKLVRNWAFNKHGEKEQERRQVYALTDWIYHGVHFALISAYEWPGDLSEGGPDLKKRHERDVMNFYIATSRDGDHWDLIWVYAGKPMIPRGRDGDFDKDIVMPASTVVTHGDKHWLYYGGANERHGTDKVRMPRKHAIGLATLRLDGFEYLRAGAKEGLLVTKPFRLDGNTLEINIDAKAQQGEFRVEVLDASGKPISGYAAQDAIVSQCVDSLRFRPRWKGVFDLSALQGRMVRLKFRLRRCKLYAFQIVNSKDR